MLAEVDTSCHIGVELYKKTAVVPLAVVAWAVVAWAEVPDQYFACRSPSHMKRMMGEGALVHHCSHNGDGHILRPSCFSNAEPKGVAARLLITAVLLFVEGQGRLESNL